MGGMAGYFPLAEQFHTQTEPAFCGLGTLVIILNALAIDPQRIWKGVWRWYGEEFLDCCHPLATIRDHGITFDEFVCLARCNGAIATPCRYHQSSLTDFRETVQQICATSAGIHLVAAYSRRILGQTGDGHFSPIAGYHAQRDLVLILDVARFKYPPHWVPLPLLWQAFEPIDPTTNQCRGYIALRKSNTLQDTFFHIAFDLKEWYEIASYVASIIPIALERAKPISADSAIRIILRNLPEQYFRILGFATSSIDIPPELQTAIRNHPLFRIVEQVWLQERSLLPRSPHSLETIPVILLACPESLYRTLNTPLQNWFSEVRQTETMDAVLAREILKLREQMIALQELCQIQASVPSGEP